MNTTTTRDLRDIMADIDTSATASLSVYRELANAVRAELTPEGEIITSGSETYPARTARPPARVNGNRVLAWAELARTEGNYPGGIVLTVRDDGGEYVIWTAYTKDGGETWAASSGDYITNYDMAWADFTGRCTGLATS